MSQQRTLTIVLTDMKGFTSRASQQSREETIALIKELRELLVPILTAHGGRLIKSTGDGFLLTFESPTDAVLAGLALQELLGRRNATRSDQLPIEVRIGINTGEVTVEDGDVIGDAVNIAARLQEIAEPNAVFLTEATRLAMNRSECTCEPLGARTFKGLPQPIEVYQALRLGRFGRRHRIRWRRWILAGGLGFVMLWLLSARHPGPSSPSATPASTPATETGQPETPAQPAPETPPASPQPSEPDPQALATIQQTLQADQQGLDNLEGELRQAQDQDYDWSRELFNLESRAERSSGALKELTRSIPQTRERHTAAVQRLIDQANGREDRATADQLWRELGQFETAIGQMEAQAGSWLTSVDDTKAALKQWDPQVSDWSQRLTSLQQTRSNLIAEAASLKTLTAPDSRLDALGTELGQLTAQVAELRQAMSGLRTDLDARSPTIDGAEQFLKSWDDFRDQWRTYLYAR